MLLTDFARLYISERTLSAKYAAALVCTAQQLSDHSRGPITTEGLNAQQINAFLYLVEKDSPIRASNKKRHLRTLWTSAHDQDLAPPVGRLRKVKVARKIPRALTIEEVGRLIQAAERLRGFIKGTPTARRLYWSSLIMAGWDTALRISDLRSIERDWIWPGGFVSIVQKKTGFSHRVQLRAETIAVIDLMLGGRKTGPIWHHLNHKNFYANLKKLAAAAGVNGTFRHLRRASASYVELHFPGRGWRHLGHAAPGLAERAYLDPAICSPEPTLPPAVDTGKQTA